MEKASLNRRCFGLLQTRFFYPLLEGAGLPVNFLPGGSGNFPGPLPGADRFALRPIRFRGLAVVILAPVAAIPRPSCCRPGSFSRSNSDGAPNAASRKRGLYSCRRPWEGTAFRRSVPLPFSAAAPCSAGWGSGAQGKPAVCSLAGSLIPLPAPMSALLSGFRAGCRKRRLSRRKASRRTLVRRRGTGNASVPMAPASGVQIRMRGSFRSASGMLCPREDDRASG